MAEFINTIDVLGDDAVIDSIIERTITEFKDNSIATVGNSAFHNCTALTELDLPNATNLGDSAFSGCSALTAVDFPAVTSIGSSAFNRCSALTALILRNETMCTLSNTNAFNNTPIASGTGYIYVPRALVDTYKAATNWSTYAAQFRALEAYTVDGTTTGALDPAKTGG